MAAVYQIITLIASDLATQAEGAAASVLSGRDRSDRSGQKRYTEERSKRTFISGVNAERSFYCISFHNRETERIQDCFKMHKTISQTSSATAAPKPCNKCLSSHKLTNAS